MPIKTGTLKTFGLTALPAGAQPLLTFRASRAAVSLSGEVLTPEPVTATLSADGTWQARLASTNGLPADVFYSVTVSWISGGVPMDATLRERYYVDDQDGPLSPLPPAGTPAIFVVDTLPEAEALAGQVEPGSIILVPAGAEWHVYKVED